MRTLFISALFVSLLIPTAVLAGPSGYQVAKTYKIGGDRGCADVLVRSLSILFIL